MSQELEGAVQQQLQEFLQQNQSEAIDGAPTEARQPANPPTPPRASASDFVLVPG